VVLHVHLYAAATGSTSAGDASDPFGPAVLLDRLARLEEGQRLVLLDQVRAWCAQSHTTVTIKPVIDVNASQWAPGYAIPDRIRDQIILRDRTCVFPWCSRPARRCQVDHIVPFDHHADTDGRPQPGPTQSDNLACLCTRHHRLKTHGRWRYRMTDPGVFEWTSPHGYRFRRDHTGSSAAHPPDRP
jgi:hypothetical protein